MFETVSRLGVMTQTSARDDEGRGTMSVRQNLRPLKTELRIGPSLPQQHEQDRRQCDMHAELQAHHQQFAVGLRAALGAPSQRRSRGKERVKREIRRMAALSARRLHVNGGTRLRVSNQAALPSPAPKSGINRDAGSPVAAGCIEISGRPAPEQCVYERSNDRRVPCPYFAADNEPPVVAQEMR